MFSSCVGMILILCCSLKCRFLVWTIILPRRENCCFTLFAVYLSCGCLRPESFPCGVVGLSVIVAYLDRTHFFYFDNIFDVFLFKGPEQGQDGLPVPGLVMTSAEGLQTFHHPGLKSVSTSQAPKLYMKEKQQMVTGRMLGMYLGLDFNFCSNAHRLL